MLLHNRQSTVGQLFYSMVGTRQSTEDKHRSERPSVESVNKQYWKTEDELLLSVSSYHMKQHIILFLMFWATTKYVHVGWQAPAEIMHVLKQTPSHNLNPYRADPMNFIRQCNVIYNKHTLLKVKKIQHTHRMFWSFYQSIHESFNCFLHKARLHFKFLWKQLNCKCYKRYHLQ